MFLHSHTFSFLVATIGIAVRPAEAQKISPVPCLDPLGCPDLLVDGGPAGLGQWVVVDETYSATDCAVVEGTTQAGDRRLIRFTYTTPNLGPGDLIIGNPADHPEWFEFATCHDHLHFREYADYRLWTTRGYAEWQALRADNPGTLSVDLLKKVRNLDQKMVAGAKLGFCVIDIIPAPSSPDYVGPSPGQENTSRAALTRASASAGQILTFSSISTGNGSTSLVSALVIM